MHNSLQKLFLFTFLLFSFFCGNAYAGTPEKNATDAPSKISSETKLFYSATLNESFFVGEHEALVNARAVINVLQGEFDGVVFEMLGQGEIENVDGDNVKDWSIRRQGARRFLEIRPKAILRAGGVFNATIVGRQAIELPATVQPLIFSNVEATAFSGLLRIVSPVALRLYAKQIRGLFPIGAPTSNELSFGISGTPALRLDVARWNELLAPVSLEAFTLRGDVGAGAVHFHVKASAVVREVNAEIPVLAGDAALKDFPENSAFSVRAEIDKKTQLPTYFLKFPQRGEFAVDLKFDARIDESDGWRKLDFAVPAVQVAPFQLYGLSKNSVFAPSSVSVPQKRGDAYEGFLPANGEFLLRWQEENETPPEFSACVFSADMCSEWRISTGLLKQFQELNLQISQGSLSRLVFDLAGEGDVVNVSGADVLAWSVEKIPADNSRVLLVALSQKKRGAYALRIESQTAFSKLPETLNPLRVVPLPEQPESAVCVRFNEFLRLYNEGNVRFDLLPRAGLTQIAPSAFPQKSDYFQKNVPAEQASVYRIAGSAGTLQVFVDKIRPDVSVFQTTRCYFDDKKIIALNRLKMEIRSAPLYEWTMDVPVEYSLVSVDSEKLASYEISGKTNGFRHVKVVFIEPIFGEHELRFTMSKDNVSAGDIHAVQGIKFPKARFLRGFIGFSGTKNVCLIPEKLAGLTEVPAEFYPQKTGKLPQQVFRLRAGDWRADVRVEKIVPTLHAQVSTIFKIAAGTILCSSKITFEGGGTDAEARFLLPVGAKFHAVHGEKPIAAVLENGIVKFPLSDSGAGKTVCTIDYELGKATVVKRASDDVSSDVFSADFSGGRLLDVAAERGEIFITSDVPLSLKMISGAQVPKTAPKKLQASETKIVADSKFAGDILLGAYQYIEPPRAFEFLFSALPEKPTQSVIITRATIETATPCHETCFGEKFSDLLCRYEYFSTGAESVELSVPAGTQLTLPAENASDDLSFDASTGVYTMKLRAGAGTFELRFSGVPASGKPVAFALPKLNVPVLLTRLALPGEFPEIDFENGRTLHENAAHFLQELQRIFSAYRIIFFTALCVFAGTLILLLTTPMWRVLKAFIALASAASCGVLIGLGTFILFLATKASYEDSVVYFSLGENTEVVFKAWCPLLEMPFGKDLFVFGLGIVLLATGTILFRNIFVRLLGRIVFYGSIIAFVQDLAHNVPAVVIVVLATETFLLVVHFCFCLKKRFSKKKAAGTISAGTLAGAFFPLAAIAFFASAGTPDLRATEIAFADNRFSTPTLKTAAPVAEAESESNFSRPQNIAERNAQTVKILSDRAVASGEIRVKGRAGERFDLLASPAVLTHFKKKSPEEPIRLERRRGKNGIVYQIVLERTGTFSAAFGYELALKPDARGVLLPTGNASADVLTLQISRPDIRLGATGATTLDVRTDDAGTQTAQIVFKPLAERKIFWNPRERNRSGERLALYAESTDLYVPAAGVVEGYHTVKLSPAQGEFDAVEISVPEPFSVSRVEGNSIRRWNFGRDRTLTVLFDTKKSVPVDISIYTQAALNISGEQNFSALSVKNCAHAMKTLGIATADDLQIDAISAPKLTPIDEKEFPQKLLERSAANGVPAHLRRAFRTIEQGASCELSLSEVKPNLRIEFVNRLALDRDKITQNIEFTAQVSRADIFNFSFPLPEGMEVESISGEQVAYWTESQDSGMRKVTIHLKKPLSGEEKFNLALAGTFPLGTPSWAVPKIVFDGAKQQSGKIFISTQEGLRLLPSVRENVVEISDDEAFSKNVPANNSAEKSPDFAFRCFGEKWNLVFDVGASQARTVATWETRVAPCGRYAFAQTEIEYSVQNTVRQSVRVRLPENALAPRFYGENVVHSGVVKNAEKENIWEVRLAKPLHGRIYFTLEYFVLLTPETPFGVIAVEGVDTEQGALKIAAEYPLSETDVKDFAKTVPVRVDSRGLLEWEARRNEWILNQKTRRFSAISGTHVLTEEVLSLVATRSDLLRIVPGEAAILQVLVDETPAKFFADETGTLYLPIYKKNAKNSATDMLLAGTTHVRIFYKTAWNADAPKIVPVRTSAHPERVVWSFAPSEPMTEIGLNSLFGLEVKYAEPALTAPDGGWKFLSTRPQLSYATQRYPHIDEGAAFAFKTVPAVPQKSHGKFFIGVLGLVFLLRALVGLRFFRKR